MAARTRTRSFPLPREAAPPQGPLPRTLFDTRGKPSRRPPLTAPLPCSLTSSLTARICSCAAPSASAQPGQRQRRRGEAPHRVPTKASGEHQTSGSARCAHGLRGEARCRRAGGPGVPRWRRPSCLVTLASFSYRDWRPGRVSAGREGLCGCGNAPHSSHTVTEALRRAYVSSYPTCLSRRIEL